MSQNIKNIVLSASFTRRNDTTAYAAEDTVNNSTSSPSVLTFSSTDSNLPMTSGKSVLLKTLKVFTDNSTVTNGSFRLNLYSSTVTPIADNSPSTLLYADKAKKIGYVDFTLTSGGTGSDSAEAFITDVNILSKLSSANLFGVLVAKAAYTPASGQNFYFELIAHEIDG